MARNLVLALLGILCFTPSAPSADNPDSVAFFEKRIRPVLVKHCYQCHASDADEIGGSLVLDSASGMMMGGDSGPAIKPGDAAGSVLISAIKYESAEMPPDEQLPGSVVRDFEAWVDAGAKDPRTNATAPPPPRAKIDIEAAREFWAFQPLEFSEPASTASGTRSVIDTYINARLREANVAANETAPPAVLLRRLSFDLTGLPPDAQLLSRWLADPTPQHWQRIVDTMLASPEFAEHWARHWMDVARYADSNGSDFNATFHEAWRYRDYLVRSFAADRPIDQMIRQQIAGDLLETDDDQERIDNVVATAFLMLGPKMLSERDKPKLVLDVVDEQIDTVGRAFLGLTLGCARCHDHKFDPVPTEDYYALAGIFKSTQTLNGESQKYVSTWNRTKLPTSPEHAAAVEKYKADLGALEKELKSAEKSLSALKSSIDTPLLGIVIDDSEAEKVGYWKPSTLMKDFVGAGYVHDDNKNKGKASIRFATRLPKTGEYEVRISHSGGSSRASAVPLAIETADGPVMVKADQRKIQAKPMWTSLGRFPFSADRDAVVTIRNDGTSGYVIADAVQFLSGDEAETPKPDNGGNEKLQLAKAKADDLKSQIKALKANPPPPLPEAMAPRDRQGSAVADSRVHVRGEVNNLGDVIPRGFLQVASPGDSSIRKPRGSGRLDLADWLTDPDNPLVARVFVNRVWMYLMGEGIVRTVDNFGLQGERPTHPDLLDALATRFVRRQWQLKPLIREIVTSRTYQRSSAYRETAMAADPENRWLWRANRKRLMAESIRDTMLVAAGQIDHRPRLEPMRGRGTLVSKNDASSSAAFQGIAEPCRSIYMPVVRGYMPPLMVMLDVADPNLLVGKRTTTSVPAQALVLINGKEVNQWARAAADRVLKSATSFDSRLQIAYLETLQRDPTAEDRSIAGEFFAGREDDREAWSEYLSAVFASTEFRLLD